MAAAAAAEDKAAESAPGGMCGLCTAGTLKCGSSSTKIENFDFLDSNSFEFF